MKVIKRIAIAAFLFLGFNINASEKEIGLKHVFDIHAKCGAAMTVGDVPEGKRVMIPITGGKVDGGIEAEIIPGGADYQMVDTVSGRVSYEAVYTLLTDDSRFINVKNVGVSVNDSAGNYFTTSPKFEAPCDSKYNWLNSRIFICKPIGFEEGMVHLRVRMVE